MPDFSLLLSLIHSERAVLNHRQTDIHLKSLSLWKQVNVCSLVVVAGLMLNVRLTNGGRLAATAASCLRRRPFPEFPPENTERATGSESETSLSSLHQITAAVYTPRTAGCLNLSWQTTKIKAFKLFKPAEEFHHMWTRFDLKDEWTVFIPFTFRSLFERRWCTWSRKLQTSWDYNQKYFYSIVPTCSVQISRSLLIETIIHRQRKLHICRSDAGQSI